MILNVDFHTVVLCPGRLLRDGGGSADEDEAFTLVEAAIQDLPAALREIARLRRRSTPPR